MKTYFLTSKVRIKACGSRRRRGKGDWERSTAKGEEREEEEVNTS